MNLDDLEKEVLGAARREMTPASEAAARVHAAVLERLAVTAVAPGAAAGTLGSATLTATAKVGMVIAVGGIGLAGSWAALGRWDAPPSPPAVHRVADPAASVTSAARPSVVVDDAALPAEDAHPSPAVAPSVRPRRAASPGQQSERSLAEEVRLLGEADRALRAHNPALAAKALAELEQKAPRGKLDEERTAVRLITNCLQSPEQAARTAARAFLAEHASSVYSGRIRESCHLSERRRDGSR
jgi:hypothetical protein